MLQKLNERIQGIVSWLIIVLVAMTFTLFGVDYYLQSRQVTNTKIVINNQAITNQAFEASYRRARAQQDEAQLSAADEKNLQEDVLNQMIRNQVTVQAAKNTGFDVSTEQANMAILHIGQFQEDGHFSSERYQHALNAALYTPETFQSEIKQGMLINQQRFTFVGSSFALPSEIERFVRFYLQTRDYDYLTVPVSQLEKDVIVSSNEINTYYKDHQKEFMSPEQVSVSYIALSMHDIRSKINVSDDEIARFYNENKSNYLTPAQWKVAHILFAIPDHATADDISHAKEKADLVYKQLKQTPKQFNKLLMQSDDKLSLAQQGVLPWIIAGQSDYDKSLSVLTQKGQISEPIQTKDGFEIFKLIDYKPVTTKTLVDMKSAIKEQLIADAAQARYTQVLEQLSDLSYQTPDSLSPAADALGIKIQNSKPFSRTDDKVSFAKNKQIVNAAFSHDVLDLGNNSEVIQLDNDAVIVLRVKDHFPMKQQLLSEVQDHIKNILLKKSAEEKATQIGKSLLNPVVDATQEHLMKTNQLKWHAVTASARENDQVNNLINEAAFNIARPESRDGVRLENGDYVVVALKHIHDGSLMDKDEEQRNSLIQQIEASYGMMDYDLYVNSLMKRAHITKN